MIDQRIRDFYASHSLTSDPGPMSSMLDGLPGEVDEIVDAIGGFLLHPVTAAELLGEPEPADQGAGELTMVKLLERLHAIDPRPLDVPRPVEKRLRVNCRGFAMMFVTILRHQGVPARKRVGFDWSGSIHEIAEYWAGRHERWILVDPDPATREPIRRFLARAGHADQRESWEMIRAGEAYHPGGLAWCRCRSGEADPGEFHDSAYTGMAGVRIALLQDLDSLNKMELRSFDEWHALMTAPWNEIDEHALDWLDEAAALTGDGDDRFEDLRAFYARSSYGYAVQARLRQLTENAASITGGTHT